MLGAFAAYFVFHGQLERFEKNPTVLSVELMPFGKFPRPSITICPKYQNYSTNELENNQNLTGAPKEQLIEKLTRVVHNANYTNLKLFKIFRNYAHHLSDIDLLQIANATIPVLLDAHVMQTKNWRRIITEAGMCYTTSLVIGVQDVGQG